jgi:hypothetical protein
MTRHRTFTVTLRAAANRDAIRGLRTFLKIAGRHFGLCAVDVCEITNNPKTLGTPPAFSIPNGQTKQRPEMTPVDMREFRKTKFLKVEDCREPRQMRIAGVVTGKYSKPDLIFENGDRLGLSATNVEILSEEYGWESEQWGGHLVELYVGQGQFEGEMVDMVLIKPLSKMEGTEQPADKTPVRKAPDKPPGAQKSGGGMDDEIPF